MILQNVVTMVYGASADFWKVWRPAKSNILMFLWWLSGGFWELVVMDVWLGKEARTDSQAGSLGRG